MANEEEVERLFRASKEIREFVEEGIKDRRRINKRDESDFCSLFCCNFSRDNRTRFVREVAE